jgi:hypothetical protein
MDYRTQLLTLSNTYAAHRRLSLSRVSTLAAGGGGYLQKIAAGASCSIDKYFRIKEWFSARWPEDLLWPTGVDRPGVLPTQTDITASGAASTPNDTDSSPAVPPPAAPDLTSGGTCGPSCPSVGGAGRLSGEGQ